MTEKNYPSPFHRVTNERISFLLPDLIEIQRNSFYEFLETGIIEEFSKINPVLLNNGEICVVFYPKEYQFTSPPFSIREAILHGKTYSAKLYVPAQICCKRTEILSQSSSSKLKNKKFVPKHKETEFVDTKVSNILTENPFTEKKIPQTKKIVKKKGEKEKIISNISNEKINQKEVKSLSTRQIINPFWKTFEKWDGPNLLQEPQFQIWSLKCWVLLGNLPLMTKRGHFIINGSPRVIVSQMIRCPGVYFHERFRGIGIQKKRTCYVDFISRRGAWLRIQSDKNRDIWIRLKRTPRIPLDIFQEGFKSFERYGKFENKSNLLDKSKKYKNSLNTLSKIVGFKRSSQVTFSFFEKKENQQGGKEIQNTSDFNSKKISLDFGTGHDLNLLSNFQLEEKRPLSIFPKTKIFAQSFSQTNTETWTDFQQTETSVRPYPDPIAGQGKSFPLERKREEGEQGIDLVNSDTSVARIADSKTVIFGIKKTKLFSKENLKKTMGQKNLLSPIEVQKKKKTKKNFYHASFPEGVRTFHASYKNSYERSIFSELFDEVQENGTKLDQPGSYNFENGKGEDLAAVGGLQFIFQKFKNPRTYDLGKLGRDRINSKLNTYTLSRQLNSKDIEFACSYLKRIEKNQILPDDIDNLKNRRVRAAGELLQAQLETGLYRLERFILSRLKPTLDTVRSPEWNSLLTEEQHSSLVRKSSLSKKWKGNAVSPYPDPNAGHPNASHPNAGHPNADHPNADHPNAGHPNAGQGKSFSSERKREKKLPVPSGRGGLEQGKQRDTLVSGKVQPKSFNSPNQNRSAGGKNLYTRKKKPTGLLTVLLRSLITTKAINGAFREFFGSNPLSQYMDQTNPLAEVTHKRRLSSLGPGGISRDTAGMAIRGIHSTHYGRICPIETPEGKNAGLVNSLTLFAQGTETGFLKTPYYKVYKGQVQKNTFPFFFSANSEQQMGITIAPGDLRLSSSHFLPPFSLPARIAGTFEDPFRRVKREKINYIALSPLQMISIATSLIPFLEHDDANRALMGSNMQRQAVPLLKPERPIVGTGLESLVVAESGQTLESHKRGLVLYSSSEKILLHKLPTEGSSWACASLVFAFRSFLVHGKSSERGIENSRSSPFGVRRPVHRRCKTNEGGQKRETVVSGIENFRSSIRPYPDPSATQGKYFSSERKRKEGLPSGLEQGKQSDFLQENGTREGLRSSLEQGKQEETLVSGISPLLTPSLGYAHTGGSMATPGHGLGTPSGTANGFSVRKLDTLVSRNLHKLVFIKKRKASTKEIEKRKSLENGTRKYIETPSAPPKGEGCEYTAKVSDFSIADTKVSKLPTAILSVQFLNRFEVLRLPTVFSYGMGYESPVPPIKGINGQRGLQRVRILGISSKLPFTTIYPLYTYQRSNQETSMSHRPAVREGDWVQKGDLLADCSASSRGELALGKNILIAYLPWEGYNFEDAVVASETLASEDLYTSVHVEKHEIEIRESRLALEEITPHIPHITKKQKESLDSKGLIKIGRWVDQGDILVAKTTAIKPKPLSPHQKLAFDLARLKPSKTKDTSLRVPKGVHGRVIRVEVLETTSVPLHLENRKILNSANSSFKLSSLGESFETNGDQILQYEKKIYKNIHKIFCESSKENTWKRKQKKILFFLCNNGISAGIPVGNLDTLVSRNLAPEGDRIEFSRSSVPPYLDPNADHPNVGHPNAGQGISERKTEKGLPWPAIGSGLEQGKQMEFDKIEEFSKFEWPLPGGFEGIPAEIKTRECFETLAVYSHPPTLCISDAQALRVSEHRWNKEKFLSLYSFQNFFFNGSLGIEKKDLKISSSEQKEICLPILLEGKEKTFFQNQLKKSFLPGNKPKSNMSIFASKANGLPFFPFSSLEERHTAYEEDFNLGIPVGNLETLSALPFGSDRVSRKKVFFCLMSNLSDDWNFRKWVCKNVISKNFRKLTRSKNIFNFFVVSQNLTTKAILRSSLHPLSRKKGFDGHPRPSRGLPLELEQGKQSDFLQENGTPYPGGSCHETKTVYSYSVPVPSTREGSDRVSKFTIRDTKVSQFRNTPPFASTMHRHVSQFLTEIPREIPFASLQGKTSGDTKVFQFLDTKVSKFPTGIPTEIPEITAALPSESDRVSEFSIHDQKPKSSIFANKFYKPSRSGPSRFKPSRSSTARSRREDVFKRKNEGNFLKKEAAFQYRGKKTIISNAEMEQDLISKRRMVPTRVRIYLAEKRKIQVGDKVAGRHGNKGIISVVLPRIDMPYLPDGRVVDMILNPLGVPSRMNVGQVFECLLGLAGVSLNQHYRIPPFDEMYGPEASRSLVYLKLYQARLRSGQHWLFHPTSPGKTRLTDGRTGEPFDQLVTTGTAYIIKLVHLVDEKIHARSTGPYSLVTKQPLGGRSKHGGQRLGEMEVWALEGFGAAYTLQEMLTSKSDDVLGRQEVLKGILSKKTSPLGNPEAFKVLVRELQSLCLDIRVSVLRGSPLRRERVDISEIR